MKLKISERALHRLNSWIMGALIVALAGLLAWLSTRYTVEADWTTAGRHSLSQASLKVLERMPEPLAITAYAREDPELRALVRKFVSRYQRARPGITLAFVNPDAAPDEVRNLGVSVHGELVLRYRDRIEHVRRDSEEEFSNALQRLLRTSERWLAFLEGHGERSALGQNGPDLGQWADQLKSRGFRFNALNLGETRAIPDNTSILVIAGPQGMVLPGEVELMLEYLDGGGNLLWLTDPGPLQGLDALAARLGVQFPAGTIIDFAGQLLGLNDPTVTLITTSLYGAHPALRDFALTSLYPSAGAITAQAGGEYKTQTLLSSGKHTWLETGPLQGEVGLDEGQDLKGPLTVGVALTRDIERPEGENARTIHQRIAVIADGDFLSNTFIANTGNLELGLRLVNWLSHDEDMITIPARTAGDTQLEMENITLGLFGIFFLVILPITLFLTGVSTWWRRRRL
ncbi:MAG: GldG family protein [Gammaproteobacteria bacterium]|nr:GldG family protein [Gammaproteobacteria bacterium]